MEWPCEIWVWRDEIWIYRPMWFRKVLRWIPKFLFKGGGSRSVPVFCFKGGKPGWAQTVGGHQGHLQTAVSPGVSCLWSCGWKSFALAVVRLVFGLLSTCLNKNLGSLGSSFGVIFRMYFSFGFRFGLCRLSSKEKGSWVSSDIAREVVSQKLLHQGWVEMWENRIWDFIFLGLWIFGGPLSNRRRCISFNAIQSQMCI